MAEAKNKIEDVETVYVKPAGGENVDEGADDQNGAAAGADDAADEGADDQGGDDEGSGEGAAAGQRQPKEKIVDTSKIKPVAPAGQQAAGGSGSNDGKKKPGPDGLVDVEGETPRERALRGQLAIANRKIRGDQAQELGIEKAPQAAAPAQREPNAANAEILKKYKPAEIAALREVLPALADEMGYVKAADLNQQTYAQQAQGVLNEFLDAHPEYSAENDQGGVLWDAFKNEYALFNKPADPKDFKKIFNRIHTSIFGIKPAGSNGALNAAQAKINVASHAGASGPARSSAPAQRQATPGLRIDMLKGFTDEEKEAIVGGAEE